MVTWEVCGRKRTFNILDRFLGIEIRSVLPCCFFVTEHLVALGLCVVLVVTESGSCSSSSSTSSSSSSSSSNLSEL
jgi:hypothetical protein